MRLARLAGLLALLGLTLSGALATARGVYGQPLDDEAVTTMHAFAVCLADHRTRDADAMLNLPPRSPESQRMMGNLAQGDAGCIHPGRLIFNGSLLAGGMAERLVMKRTGAAGFTTRVAYDASRLPITASDASEMVGMCVVRADPAAVWSIFTSEPASPREARAIEAITPTLTGCVPAGRQATFNRPALRATLALAAYRLVQPPMASARGS